MNKFYNYYLLQLKKYILQLPTYILIYFPFRRWKFVKFTLTFPDCIFTIHNTTTSVLHFSYIFLITTKFRFACVFWLLGNIKQPPLTPKLSTAYAGVDLTLPNMTSHGAYYCTVTTIDFGSSLYISSAFFRVAKVKYLTWFTWFSTRNLLCILHWGFLDVIYVYARLEVLAGAQANLIFVHRSRILSFR